MITYSFIIPHKNTPELLQRCIDSIPQRNDSQIIIVDDNSDPSIVDFDAFPGSNRSDIICIFDKEGRGAGVARNIAIQHAEGEWLLFSDSDDYFTPDLSSLLDKYHDINNVDMVFLNAKSVNEYGEEIPLPINRYIFNCIKRQPFCLNVLKFSFWAPWSRMVKKRVFTDNNIIFEDVPVGNDTMGILNASKYSKTFAIEPTIIYMYYKPNSGSQTNTVYNDQSYFLRLEQKLKVNVLYKEVGYPFYWPIMYGFRNKTLNQTVEFKTICKKYNFSYCKDFITLLIYVFAKSLKIL